MQVQASHGTDADLAILLKFGYQPNEGIVGIVSYESCDMMIQVIGGRRSGIDGSRWQVMGTLGGWLGRWELMGSW